MIGISRSYYMMFFVGLFRLSVVFLEFSWDAWENGLVERKLKGRKRHNDNHDWHTDCWNWSSPPPCNFLDSPQSMTEMKEEWEAIQKRQNRWNLNEDESDPTPKDSIPIPSPVEGVPIPQGDRRSYSTAPHCHRSWSPGE